MTSKPHPWLARKWVKTAARQHDRATGYVAGIDAYGHKLYSLWTWNQSARTYGRGKFIRMVDESEVPFRIRLALEAQLRSGRGSRSGSTPLCIRGRNGTDQLSQAA